MLVLFFLALFAVASAQDKPRVLLVVTSVSEWTPTTGQSAGAPKATGIWLTEFTHSYTVFDKAGYDIDVASPLGGNAKADAPGFIFYAQDPDTQALIEYNAENPLASRLPVTENTLVLSEVDPDLYEAIFFVGGTGAMWDFPHDPSINSIVNAFWAAGKTVGGVCHGPIAFTSVVLPNGRPFVEGRMITAFANDEEQLLGATNECAFCWLGFDPSCDPLTCAGAYMPTEYSVKRTPLTGTPDDDGVASFLIETKLKELGAKFISTFQNWSNFYFVPHVVRDGRLVTGQNPGAGRETAQMMVETMKQIREQGSLAADTVVLTQVCTPIQVQPNDPAPVCTTRGNPQPYFHTTTAAPTTTATTAPTTTAPSRCCCDWGAGPDRCLPGFLRERCETHAAFSCIE